MSQDIDVLVDGVSKRYRLGARRRASHFWALSDVSFAVPRGQSLGIIGPNGAGKSTLLKLLAGITAPTRGTITMDGRLAALIEVGSGFHPELTGRENVHLSGALLGMRRREIAARLDAIVAFAGVERFLDTPVKHYSSGMYVRLGFAIAAHLEPDILLVDEVLAVGDAEFQARCLRRIAELSARGVTTLFISHDLTTVEQLCRRVLLLEGGHVVADGPPAELVSLYHRRVVARARAETPPQPGDLPAYRDQWLRLTNLTLHAADAGPHLVATSGDPLVARLRFAVTRPVEQVRFELGINSADGRTRLATLATPPAATRPPGGIAEFQVHALPLQEGSYAVAGLARDSRTGLVIDWWDGGTTLHVQRSPGALPGQMHLPHTARVLGDSSAAAVDPVPPATGP